MHRFTPVAFVVPAALVVLALAAAVISGPPAAAAEAQGDAKSGTVGQYVDLSPVGLPVTWKGRLVNYIFVTLRLDFRSSDAASRMQTKEPYFRAALVRLGSEAPLNRPGDLVHLDDAALKARMLARSAAIAGPDQVTGVEILTETPQHLTGLPDTSPHHPSPRPVY